MLEATACVGKRVLDLVSFSTLLASRWSPRKARTPVPWKLEIMSAIDKNCTFLISTDKSSGVQQDDICKMLESTEVPHKIEGLKKAITGMLAGESMPRVLMTVIR